MRFFKYVRVIQQTLFTLSVFIPPLTEVVAPEAGLASFVVVTEAAFEADNFDGAPANQRSSSPLPLDQIVAFKVRLAFETFGDHKSGAARSPVHGTRQDGVSALPLDDGQCLVQAVIREKGCGLAKARETGLEELVRMSPVTPVVSP